MAEQHESFDEGLDGDHCEGDHAAEWWLTRKYDQVIPTS
jgi:hypothetical protein